MSFRRVRFAAYTLGWAFAAVQTWGLYFRIDGADVVTALMGALACTSMTVVSLVATIAGKPLDPMKEPA